MYDFVQILILEDFAREINSIRLHSNCDVLLVFATIFRWVKPKNATFIPRLFLASRPAARNYQFRFLPCVFVTFHGPRSPQLENGTFERVNASIRDRRACPETKGPGFTLLRQCFRNNVRSICINFLLPWTHTGCCSAIIILSVLSCTNSLSNLD